MPSVYRLYARGIQVYCNLCSLVAAVSIAHAVGAALSIAHALAAVGASMCAVSVKELIDLALIGVVVAFDTLLLRESDNGLLSLDGLHGLLHCGSSEGPA